jgi:hypothetical protein
MRSRVGRLTVSRKISGFGLGSGRDRRAHSLRGYGSVLFAEAELKVNTLAYLAQHLVVLLHESAIVAPTQRIGTK